MFDTDSTQCAVCDLCSASSLPAPSTFHFLLHVLLTAVLFVVQRTLWSLALLSNCSSTPGSSCPLVDLNNRAYLNMSSADTSIIKVMTGFPSNACEYGLQ